MEEQWPLELQRVQQWMSLKFGATMYYMVKALQQTPTVASISSYYLIQKEWRRKTSTYNNLYVDCNTSAPLILYLLSFLRRLSPNKQ